MFINLKSTYIVLFLCLFLRPVFAQNVDVSTLPPRDTVQLTIYNSADLTLVKETRFISFKPGMNPLQYSWIGTQIDSSSVQLRFLTEKSKLNIIDTRFPHDKPDMLYWRIDSQLNGAAQVEISYFTSGLSWSADYIARINHAETHLNLESYIRVTNHSGEDYDHAQIRVVVGDLNLVESINDLSNAYSTLRLAKKDNRRFRAELKKESMKRSILEEAEIDMAYDAVGSMTAAPKPKSVAKAQLSEYFIYTIEGTESIPDGWSKRLRSFTAKAVPLQIQYRYRLREYGDQLVRLYIIRNDSDANLGTTPLPNGEVRILRDNGRAGLSYLAQQTIQYVPIGDKLELNLGQDPNVHFELHKQRVWRDEILMSLKAPNAYQKLKGGIRFSSNSRVVGWDEHVHYVQRIRNDTGKAIELEIRREYTGDTRFKSTLKPTLFDYRTVEYKAKLEATEKNALAYEIIMRKQKNAKNHRVSLQ